MTVRHLLCVGVLSTGCAPDPQAQAIPSGDHKDGCEAIWFLSCWLWSAQFTLLIWRYFGLTR